MWKFLYDTVDYDEHIRELHNFYKVDRGLLEVIIAALVIYGGATNIKNISSNVNGDISISSVLDESKLKVYPKRTILGVFRSGILRHSFPVCVTAHPVTINQDLKAFSIDGKKIKKLYFTFYLNLLQDMVLNVSMKKGVTVESINADAFMNIPFVCPPMIKQSEIVRYVYEKKKLIFQKREEAKRLRLQAINDFETKIYK